MKYQSTQTLKKKFWKVFSEYIRRRDKGICISCGKRSRWQDMDAGHYIPKTRGLAIYFDEKNVNCQCTSCNRFQHGNLSDYAIGLKTKYGNDVLDELDYKQRQRISLTSMDYIEFIKIYKQKIKDLVES